MIKALFFDIDGTLVSFKTHVIPQSTIDAINQVKQKGIKVFISTGRPKVIINNLGTLEFDGFITMNGAYCYVGKEEKVIHKNAISPEDVKTIADMVSKNNLTSVFVTENRMQVVNRSKVSDEFSNELAIQILPEESIDNLVCQEIYQVSPFITEVQEKNFMQNLSNCQSGRWHPLFTDIVAKGNGKNRGIDEIIRYFGIRLDETMSFGDGGNDIPMLRHAGIGVAMGNASDSVKETADYITDTVDNNGILKALKHFKIC